MIPQLLWIAAATFVSEDLTCIAAGVLVAQGKLSFPAGTAACLLGIVAGDMLLFLAGRLFGARALRWSPLARLVPTAMVDQGARWLQQRGMMVVLLSRFTPGLRLPTYFAAGVLPTKWLLFLTWFVIAAAIWTPLLVGAAAVFGDGLLSRIFSQGGHTLTAFAIVVAMLAITLRAVSVLRTFPGRRRVIGFFKRKVRWEFWPAWAAYLPLLPYLLYLAARHRSLTLFTAANPGIPSGGFVGESKSEILSHLSRIKVVPAYTLIRATLEPVRRVQAAQGFLAAHGLGYPVVLKPDVGERGTGVAVVRSFDELEAHLHRTTRDTILQRHIAGVEFGIFYVRYPHASRGRISSITEKRFPAVTGDGKSTLRRLILSDPRAVCLAAAYQQASRRPLDDVPAPGEIVPLVELGSHCRGAVFLDGSHLRTQALEDAMDRISRAHPGFYFGRFDIRAPSAAALRQGQSLNVIELNGVSAEPAHIYDPSVNLYEAYRVMCRHWRMAFELGAANRDRGARPMPIAAFVRLLAGRVSPQPSATTDAVREAMGNGCCA